MKNKRRQDELTKKYLINQINLFKEKSAQSIKDAQNFAIDQNMIIWKTIIFQTFQDQFYSKFPEDITELKPQYLDRKYSSLQQMK